MLRAISLIALLAAATSVAIAQESNSVLRMQLPLSIMLGVGEEEVAVEDLAVTAGSLPELATTGDAINVPLTITGGRPPYKVELAGSSIPPLAQPSAAGVTGAFTTGEFSFSAVISDSSKPPQMFPTGTWDVAVADPLTIGAIPARFDVTAATESFFDLPTTAGGTGPMSFEITPAGSVVTVSGNKLRVLAEAAGSVDYAITAIDSKGRRSGARSFTVVAQADPVQATGLDVQIQSITGGSLVKGASNRIQATATGKSGGLETRTSLRVAPGETVLITYKEVMKANRMYMDFYTVSTATCNNSTPTLKYIIGNPAWRFETSIDGFTWHHHTNSMDKWNYPDVICGWTGNWMALDVGHTTFKYARLVMISTMRTNGVNVGVDIPKLRLQN